MSFQRGFDGSDPFRSESVTGGAGWHEERRVRRMSHIATGTLACPECDAPIALHGQSLAPTDVLGCPFCGHDGPLRDFLSLAQPTRPTRVVVRIVAGQPRVAPRDERDPRERR